MSEKHSNDWLPFIMEVNHEMMSMNYSGLQKAVIAAISNELGSTIVGLNLTLESEAITNLLAGSIHEIKEVLEEYMGELKAKINNV